MKIYKLEVEKGYPQEGYFKDIPNTLKAMQEEVGGHIETVQLSEKILLIFNEEGKCLNLPGNRLFLGENGEILDYVCGNAFCARYENDEITDIHEEDKAQIEKCISHHTQAETEMLSIARQFCSDVEFARRIIKAGMVLELTADLEDPFTAKKKGDRFVVSMIDDAGNIHGHWQDSGGGSMSLIMGVDSFRIVSGENE